MRKGVSFLIKHEKYLKDFLCCVIERTRALGNETLNLECKNKLNIEI